MTSSITDPPNGSAAALASKFDLDIDPGPVEATYTPSADMLETIDAIAALEDVAFRFWAASTVFTNMSSITPCRDAEDVVMFVVNDAIEDGDPTDGHYQLILDDTGQIAGVAHEDETPDEPCEYDRLIFEIVRQAEAADRRSGLAELATLSAITEENDGNCERLTECRYWAADNPETSATRS